MRPSPGWWASADFAAERRRIVRSLSAFNDRLGPLQALRSVDYFRCLEVVLALRALAPEPGRRLLDMGCGTGPVPSYLAAVAGLRVTAIDLDPAAVGWQRRTAARAAVSTGAFQAVCGDSRELPLDDASSDLILNLSSIEHIPGDGDLAAMREVARVLGPGGRAVLTLPFGPALTERTGTSHTRAFERRYDDAALDRRIVAPSGLIERDRVLFGEPGFRASRPWFALPGALRFPLRRLGPALAARFLHPLESSRADRAVGVCLCLERPG